MRTLGVDIGTRNFGICILDNIPGDDYVNVMYLKKWDLASYSTVECVTKLIEKLEEIWESHIVFIDAAGIEQQPEQHHLTKRRFNAPSFDNTQMKSISHAVQAYFLTKKKPVQFIAARSKSECCELEVVQKYKSEYTQYKFECTQKALHLLKLNKCHDSIAYVNTLSKIDDVLDAYLIAYSLLVKIALQKR